MDKSKATTGEPEEEKKDTETLEESELLLTPPLVYGFSLEKKLWRKFFKNQKHQYYTNNFFFFSNL